MLADFYISNDLKLAAQKSFNGSSLVQKSKNGFFFNFPDSLPKDLQNFDLILAIETSMFRAIICHGLNGRCLTGWLHSVINELRSEYYPSSFLMTYGLGSNGRFRTFNFFSRKCFFRTDFLYKL